MGMCRNGGSPPNLVVFLVSFPFQTEKGYSTLTPTNMAPVGRHLVDHFPLGGTPVRRHVCRTGVPTNSKKTKGALRADPRRSGRLQS